MEQQRTGPDGAPLPLAAVAAACMWCGAMAAKAVHGTAFAAEAWIPLGAAAVLAALGLLRCVAARRCAVAACACAVGMAC